MTWERYNLELFFIEKCVIYMLVNDMKNVFIQFILDITNREKIFLKQSSSIYLTQFIY